MFALCYLVQPGAIANARPGAFADAFFFSVQTMATVGYGQMAPATLYANLVVTVETAVGLMFLALATGLVFARSRSGIPSDFLFRTGGDTSVRGYSYQSLGVPQGDAIVGGRMLVVV